MSIFDIFKKGKKSNDESNLTSSHNGSVQNSSELAMEVLMEVLTPPEERELDLSMRKHTIMALALIPENVEFRFYQSYNNVAWLFKEKRFICTKDNPYFLGTSAFAWLLSKRKDPVTFCRIMDILVDNMVEIWGEVDVEYNDITEIIESIQYYIPSFALGNDPNTIKKEIEWAYIDLQAIERFIHLFNTHMKSRTVEQLKNPFKFEGEYNTVADLLDACLSDVMFKNIKI